MLRSLSGIRIGVPWRRICSSHAQSTVNSDTIALRNLIPCALASRLQTSSAGPSHLCDNLHGIKHITIKKCQKRPRSYENYQSSGRAGFSSFRKITGKSVFLQSCSTWAILSISEIDIFACPATKNVTTTKGTPGAQSTVTNGRPPHARMTRYLRKKIAEPRTRKANNSIY